MYKSFLALFTAQFFWCLCVDERERKRKRERERERERFLRATILPLEGDVGSFPRKAYGIICGSSITFVYWCMNFSKC